jgi:imidazolonepropionase-like amidohydrolase
MILTIIIALVVASWNAAAHADNSSAIAEYEAKTILQCVNVVDVIGGRLLADMDVTIEGASIRDVSKHDPGAKYGSGHAIMLVDHYVIPGLIEGHSHVTSIPEANLTAALKKGVVAVRDMAGDGAYIRDLQKAISNGELIAPDIYFSAVLGGPELIRNDSRVKLVTPPEYVLGEAPWARQVDENSDVAQIVADAKNCGASGIKLYAYLSSDLTRRLATEARRQGLGVWAHFVVFPATAEDVVSSGVEVVSHAAFLLLPRDWNFEEGSAAMDPLHADPARLKKLFSTMNSFDVALDPTLVVTGRMVSSLDKARAEDLKRAVYGATRLAYDMGVAIIAGTDEDLPGNPGGRLPLHEELELYVNEVGMTPMDALRAATINTARVMNLEKTAGTVEPGKPANLVVLKSNPLVSIAAIENVAFVVSYGRIVQ